MQYVTPSDQALRDGQSVRFPTRSRRPGVSRPVLPGTHTLDIVKVVELVLVIVWAWGWGYWSHDATGPEKLASVAWPILVPTGMAYHQWRWGPKGRRRYVYDDTRWWQRGDRHRRSLDWKDSA